MQLRLPREEVTRATAIHFAHGFAADIGGEVQAHPDLVTPYAAELVRWASQCSAGAEMSTGLELEAALYRPVGELLEDYDALVVPTSCVAALDAGEDYAERSLTAGGVELSYYMENFFTPLFNIMSRCPVLAVPSGFGSRNAPTGVQIAGRTYDDMTVFRVGAALEAVRPWTARPVPEVETVA